MKTTIFKRLSAVILALCAVCLLGACSRLANIELPPLPTVGPKNPIPTEEAFILDPRAALSEAQQQELLPGQDLAPASSPNPVFTPAPELTPEPVPAVTPEPMPVVTPEPTPEPEDPNIPHMHIENATYPENMSPGGVAYLYGNIVVDKGLIVQVRGRIVDADGYNVQQCIYYPYESSFSLAGTVNSELVFGLLEPGHYAYIVSAIAENNSYTNGEEVLIEHPFEIYYP